MTPSINDFSGFFLNAVTVSTTRPPANATTNYSADGYAGRNFSPGVATYDDWQAAGGGNLAFNLTARRGYFSGSRGNLSLGPIMTAESGEFTVTYTYTVPEPSTWALLGLGAVVVLWSARRRLVA